MSNQNSATQLMEVANRIRDMRELLGYSMQKMAELTEVNEEIYHQYESGTVDLPFTFLHKCAKVFGVEITLLLEGSSAKLTGYTVTRKNKGLVTASEDGITIQDMAPMFRKKLATPYWVTYEYDEKLHEKTLLEIGREEGMQQGIQQGIQQGEHLLGTLISRLLADGRTEDVKLAASDEEARKRFYKEYGIID